MQHEPPIFIYQVVVPNFHADLAKAIEKVETKTFYSVYIKH